ncbi:MAG: nitrile hydratase subunit beta [Pseudomonadota bacterium]
MDGVHDLGGVEGFGRLPIEDNEPAFHDDWEAKVMAMRLLMGAWRKWNIDAGRHSVETLPPADYLTLTYYEKWLASLVFLSERADLITRDEIASGVPAPGSVKSSPPIDGPGFLALMAKGRPSERAPTAAAKFALGDQVRTARHMHAGHTRLPRYLRGCVGEIVLLHGTHVLPDVSSRLTGDEGAEPLYGVRFSAREVWGNNADPKLSITADLWESYLAAA